jgi:CrcB protein
LIFNSGSIIPIDTLIVNITGSFLLSMLLTAALEVKSFDEDMKLGITTGFFGAFTTFSTLSRELFEMITGGSVIAAALYMLLSAAAGMAAAFAGATAGRAAAARIR